MKVKLSSCGNIDKGQNPYKKMSPSKLVTVEDLKMASLACLEYIKKWNLGGGNWTGGQILSNGKQIAAVSYNGRVWDRHGKEIR